MLSGRTGWAQRLWAAVLDAKRPQAPRRALRPRVIIEAFNRDIAAPGRFPYCTVLPLYTGALDRVKPESRSGNHWHTALRFATRQLHSAPPRLAYGLPSLPRSAHETCYCAVTWRPPWTQMVTPVRIQEKRCRHRLRIHLLAFDIGFGNGSTSAPGVIPPSVKIRRSTLSMASRRRAGVRRKYPAVTSSVGRA